MEYLSSSTNISQKYLIFSQWVGLSTLVSVQYFSYENSTKNEYFYNSYLVTYRVAQKMI